MAGGSDIRAGGAFVELFTKDQKFKSGMKGFVSTILTVGKIASGVFIADLGVKAVAKIGELTTHFATAGSALYDMSARTGLAAGNLAELKYAAEQSGTSIDDVEKGLRKMAKGGLDVAKFDELAASVGAIEDPTKRAAKAQEVWGKSGTKMLPMIAELKGLRAEARGLGLAPSDKDVALADRLGDAFDRVKSVMGATFFKLGASLAPILIPLVETTAKLIAKFNEWAFSGGFVIDTIKAIGAALSGGKLGLAAQIAVAAMTVPFEWFKLQMFKIWEFMKLHALSVFDSIADAMVPTVAYLTSLWNTFVNWAAIIFHGTFGITVGQVWDGFRIAATVAIDYVWGKMMELWNLFKTFFNIVGIGLKEVVREAGAAIAIVAPIAVGQAGKATGIDIGRAMQDASAAAAAAKEQAAADTRKRQEDRKAESDARIKDQAGALGAAKDRLKKLQAEAGEVEGTGKKRAAAVAEETAGSAIKASTFSAAGAASYGFGGGPVAAPVVKELKENNKKTERVAVAVEKLKPGVVLED